MRQLISLALIHARQDMPNSTRAVHDRIELLGIGDVDFTRCWHLDVSKFSESRQHPADGFLRETGVVADVSAGHRERYDLFRVRLLSLGQKHKQKRRNLLIGRLAPEQDDVILSVDEL